MANFMQMMQKAQQMKKKMADMQDSLRDAELTAESGGGKVTVTVNGRHEMKRLRIDPALIAANDAETVEDLVMAAVNNAHGMVEQRIASESKRIMDELGLPPGMMDQLM